MAVAKTRRARARWSQRFSVVGIDGRGPEGVRAENWIRAKRFARDARRWCPRRGVSEGTGVSKRLRHQLRERFLEAAEDIWKLVCLFLTARLTIVFSPAQ